MRPDRYRKSLSKTVSDRRHRALFRIPCSLPAVLSLMPWLLLSLANGGPHNHAFNHGSPAAAVWGPNAAPADLDLQLPPDRQTAWSALHVSSTAFCPACFWQLSLNVCAVADALIPSAPIPMSLPWARQLPSSGSREWAFHPRAPPLI
jgi:hypothetical protein